MKYLSIASLALVFALSGCSTSSTAEERISQFRNEFEAKLEKYEECLKANAVLSPKNPYFEIKPLAIIELAFSSCAQYRP